MPMLAWTKVGPDYYRKRKRLVRGGAVVFLLVLLVGLPYEIHRYDAESKDLANRVTIGYPGPLARSSPKVLLGPGGLSASRAFGSDVRVERSFHNLCDSANRQAVEIGASVAFLESDAGPRAVALVYCRTLTGGVGSLVAVYRPDGSLVKLMPPAGFLPGIWRASITKHALSAVPAGPEGGAAPHGEVVDF